MRTIKFRGKDIDGVWRFGDLIHVGEGVMIVHDSKLTIDNSLDENTALVYSMNEISVVYPATIGQITGLYDSTKWESLSREEQALFLAKRNKDGKQNSPKDWNGKEIYEGDICSFNWSPFFNEPSSIFNFELPVMYYDGWGCWCFHLQTNKMKESQREIFTDYSTQELYVAIGSPIMYGDGIEIVGNIHDNPELLKD